MKLKKTIGELVCILTLLISAIPIVTSDGCHFSDEYYHLYEPYQKAAIYWDGTMETLILASACQSDNLTDIAWVVPILSTTQPNVTVGNISIFNDLVNYFDVFNERFISDGIFSFASLGSKNSVVVLEVKEIDIYDVTILKANSASDLVNWLLENNFKVPKEATNVFKKYVNSENCYFIVNKLDLKNKYKDVVSLIENETIKIDFRTYNPLLNFLNDQ